MPIRPPIVIVAGDDLYVLDSKEDAETWIDPVDVVPGEHGYDADGRLFQVAVRGAVTSGRFGVVDGRRSRVEVVLAEEKPTHHDALRAVLVGWLRRRGAPAGDLDVASTQELVRRVAADRRKIAAAGAKGVMTIGKIVLLAIAGLILWWLRS